MVLRLFLPGVFRDVRYSLCRYKGFKLGVLLLQLRSTYWYRNKMRVCNLFTSIFPSSLVLQILLLRQSLGRVLNYFADVRIVQDRNSKHLSIVLGGSRVFVLFRLRISVDLPICSDFLKSVITGPAARIRPFNHIKFII